MSVGEMLDRDVERPAYVRFEKRAVKDNEASLKAGHYVSKDVDWVMVTPPYSKDCYENKALLWLNQAEENANSGRIPRKHFESWKQAYEAWKRDEEPPLDGTSIKDWNALSPAQCKNILSSGCRTIEDLAQINDEGMRRLGMGAVDLKKKAVTWLQAAKDHGPLINQVSQLQKENEQLKGSLDALQEQVRLLTAQQGSKWDAIPDIQGKTPIERYIEKYGKKPHHKMKPETILQKLEE